MKYVIYCRKSTEDKNKQLQSIPSQKRELLDFANKQGIDIVEMYSESRSAKNTGRPEFGKMLNDLKAGRIDAVLCWKLDRLSRNMYDAGEIIHLLQNSVIKKIVTPMKTFLPTDNVYEILMELGGSNQYSRDLSVNVKRGNREKLRNGGWPSMAPIGYLNDKVNKTIVVDPQRAPFIKRVFEMYSTGLHSLQEIADILSTEGFTSKSNKASRATGKKVYKGKIHNILINPFYYGLMSQHGALHKGNHEPLISKRLFDKCQDVLNGGKKPKPKKHKFLFRGLCTCDKCGCAITAEKQRGYSYYHCTNGKLNCDQKKYYLRGRDLEKQVINTVLPALSFNESLIEKMYQKALELQNADSESDHERVSFLEKKIEDAEKMKSRLVDMMLEDRITKELYDTKLQEIENELTNLELSLETAKKVSDHQFTIEQTRDCFKAFIAIKKAYSRLSDGEKRKSLLNLLSNISLRERKVVSFQYKTPYDIIAKLPKNASFSVLWKTWDDVRTSINK